MTTIIRVRPNGPLLVEGPVTVIDSNGNAFPLNPDKPAVERCAGAGSRPNARSAMARTTSAGFNPVEIAPVPASYRIMEPRISLITFGCGRSGPRAALYRDGLVGPPRGPATGRDLFSELRHVSGTVSAGQTGRGHLARDAHGAVPLSSGITLAHNVREKHEVDEVLALAARAGATIEKPAQDTFWGGYSGYFSDPDGHLWEVASRRVSTACRWEPGDSPEPD